MVDTESIEGYIERAREIEEITPGGRWIGSPERKRGLALFVSREKCGGQPNVCRAIDVNNGPNGLVPGQSRDGYSLRVFKIRHHFIGKQFDAGPRAPRIARAGVEIEGNLVYPELVA
jgi:hypothetical protein